MNSIFNIDQSEKVFITSDHHFGHENIIKFTDRPYSSVEQMDAELIENWNRYIKKDDTVFHLGDFTLGEMDSASKYFSQLNGKIFILAQPWHHDRRWLPKDLRTIIPYTNCTVQFCPPMVMLEVSNMVLGSRPLPITLCHYPLAEWDRKHYGAWHLHGHSHGKYKTDDFAVDVGVEHMNYYPIRLDNVSHEMYGRGFVQYG